MTTQEINMTGAEFEAYGIDNKTLSDMDYSYNKESGEYDVPALEWDTYMGRFWDRYDSEEARTEALKEYNDSMVTWTMKRRIEKEEARVNKIAEARRVKTLKSLGGQFPELVKLLKVA